MTEQNKESPGQTDASTLGLVCYTDGGARPNPGYGGKGLHCYLYDLKTPFKTVPSGCSMVPSTHGYIEQGTTVEPVLTPEASREKLYQDIPQAVTVTEFLEMSQSPTGYVSNNVCEIDALCEAFKIALDRGVSFVHVLTDSDNTKKAANEWMYTWRNNGWVKNDGREVANVQSWIELIRLRDELETKGALVRVTWVRAHNGEIGNEAADALATMSVFQSRHALGGKAQSHVFSFPPNGRWKHSVDKHPFLSHKYCYFNTLEGAVTPGKYFIGNHGKNDEMLGKRMSDAGFAVIHLGKPNPTVELVRSTQARYSEGADSLYILYMDHAFNLENNHELNSYRELSLQPPSGYRLDLLTRQDIPITTERKPAMLAWRGVEELEWLNQLLEQFDNKDPALVVTNITETLYETTQKVVTGKKGVPAKVEISAKLKSDIVVGCTHFVVKAGYKFDQTEGLVELRLTTGIDILDRNALKRLESSSPQVHVVTWVVGDNAIRYATIITTDDCRGIWAGPYSNFCLVV